jgi:hypothetical protein
VIEDAHAPCPLKATVVDFKCTYFSHILTSSPYFSNGSPKSLSWLFPPHLLCMVFRYCCPDYSPLIYYAWYLDIVVLIIPPSFIMHGIKILLSWLFPPHLLCMVFRYCWLVLVLNYMHEIYLSQDVKQPHVNRRGRRDLDSMLVGFTTNCAINTYHHQSCEMTRCTRYNN